MLTRYRVQLLDGTGNGYDPAPPLTVRAHSLHEALGSLGTPHGRANHVWAQVWSIPVKTALLIDGQCNVILEKDVTARWGK